MKAGIYSPKISVMIRWKVVGGIFSLNIITTATKMPHSMMKVVFVGIWLYPLKPSKELYGSWPTTASRMPSLRGKVNASLAVSAFNIQ